MRISDEDLVEYLRGCAPQLQKDEIERQLAVDPDLVQRLGELRILLGQIDTLYGVFEPPSDLVEGTLARIDRESVPPGKPAQTMRTSASSATVRSSATLWDSTALMVSLTVLCCLILPAIVRARFDSRKVQCANNLRSTGMGLINFAINDPHQRFPRVDLSGPMAFAGVYAIHLKSFGLPIHPGQLRCPSLIGSRRNGSEFVIDTIPTIWEFSEMTWDDVDVQRIIGGDYAYNLGVTEGEAVVAPQYAGRKGFAILADSPVFVGNAEELVAHDGMGLNILYEDGHVAFLNAQVVLPRGQVLDHPFRNLRGVHAVGLIPQDASLAPSHFSPLGGK